MWQKMLQVGSGGSARNLFVKDNIKLLQTSSSDAASKTYTVPTGTDIIFIYSGTVANVTSNALTCINVLEKVGDTFYTSQSLGGTSINNQSLTVQWLSATSVTATRSGTWGYYQLFFIQYINK